MTFRSDKKHASWVKNISREGFSTAPLNRDNFSTIRLWRNSQMDILRQASPLSEKDQTEYYESHIRHLYFTEKPAQMLFGLFKDNEFIAYGGLVHIDWEAERAELSFLYKVEYHQAPDAHSEAFNVFLQMMKEFAFQTAKLNIIHTETFDIRPEHIIIMEDNGFIPEGRMRRDIKIQGKFIDSLLHGIIRTDPALVQTYGERQLSSFSMLVTSAS